MEGHKMESKPDINITEEDVVGLMDNFTKVPSFILKKMVSRNLNVVKSFESRIEAYKYQLTDNVVKDHAHLL